MSETTTIPTPADVAPQQPAVEPASTEPKPTETVDFWKQKAREQETRAKANADAAKRLAEIEEASKTAEQKNAERLAALERENAELAAMATITKIAANSNIPADILAGPRDRTPEAVQEFADRLSSFLDERGKPRTPRPNPAQGDPAQPLALNDSDGLTRAVLAKVDRNRRPAQF